MYTILLCLAAITAKPDAIDLALAVNNHNLNNLPNPNRDLHFADFAVFGNAEDTTYDNIRIAKAMAAAEARRARLAARNPSLSIARHFTATQPLYTYQPPSINYQFIGPRCTSIITSR